jgi:hypothetical protein
VWLHRFVLLLRVLVSRQLSFSVKRFGGARASSQANGVRADTYAFAIEMMHSRGAALGARTRAAVEIYPPPSTRRHLQIGMPMANFFVIEAKVGAFISPDKCEGKGHFLPYDHPPASMRDLERQGHLCPTGFKKCFGSWLNHNQVLLVVLPQSDLLRLCPASIGFAIPTPQPCQLHDNTDIVLD